VDSLQRDGMREKMRSAPGFIAALDQSGGSTPKALVLYGGLGADGPKPDRGTAEQHRVVATLGENR